MYSTSLITAYIIFVAAVLGLVTGSFVNCWAWRYVRGESVMAGRSHCATCGHELGARDLVPVFSWLAGKGRCRYCGEKVSARYPATELVCAAVFVAIAARYGVSWETAELLAFAGILLFLSLVDLESSIIPNGAIVAAIAVRAVYLAVACGLGWLNAGALPYYVASGVGMGAVLLAVVLVADKLFGRESMGGGDLKLYAVAGFYFGWQQGLLLVILSCVFGIVVAALGLRSAPGDVAQVHAPAAPEAPEVPDAPEVASACSDRSAVRATSDAPEAARDGILGTPFPFGPSIAAACVVVMLAGAPVLTWYLALL